MTDKALRALWTQGQHFIRWGRGTQRPLRPSTLTADTAAKYAAMRDANEAVQYFPQSELQRIQATLYTGMERERHLMAGVAAWHLHQPMLDVIAQGRQEKTRILHDVLLTSPSALDDVTADGKISLALFRLQREQQLATAPLALLQRVYEAALRRRDAPSQCDLQLVEERVDQGLTLATHDEQRPARELRELVESVRMLRLPVDHPDWDRLDRDASVLRSRAAALNVVMVNPQQQPGLWKTFQAVQRDIEALGQADDVESIEAFRQQHAAVEAPSL